MGKEAGNISMPQKETNDDQFRYAFRENSYSIVFLTTTSFFKYDLLIPQMW